MSSAFWLLTLTLATLSSSKAHSVENIFCLHSHSARLVGHPIVRIVPEVSLIKCATVCARNQSHVAFNYNAVNRSCELIVKQDDILNTTLIDNANYSYYIRTNLTSCVSNPCLYGSMCVPTEDGLDYQCLNCPAYFSGKNCEDLICGIHKCSQHNNTLYFEIEMAITWESARQACASEGMSLAMPKDQETNEFVIVFLKSVYGQSTQIEEWIGLKNEATEWRWVDGSPLGSYTGNSPDFKSSPGPSVTSLYINGEGNIWNPYLFDSPKAVYYYICEKPIFPPPG